jgi:hypothetical protein
LDGSPKIQSDRLYLGEILYTETPKFNISANCASIVFQNDSQNISFGISSVELPAVPPMSASTIRLITTFPSADPKTIDYEATGLFF